MTLSTSLGLSGKQPRQEIHGRHITAGLCFVRRGVQPNFDEMVDYGDWDGEFVLGQGILASVRFDLSLDAEPVLALAAIRGVG